MATEQRCCLTGGSSPLGLYRLLASHPWRDQVPWDRVHIEDNLTLMKQLGVVTQ